MSRRGPAVAASLAAVMAASAVVIVTRSRQVLDITDLTLLLLAAAWALSAVAIACGPGAERFSARLRSLRAPPALLLAATAGGAVLAAMSGRFNGNILLAVCLAAHWTLAAARPRLFLLTAGFVGGSVWALANGALALFASSPRLARIPALTALAKSSYMSDWNVIHTDPDCVEFDEELLYRLRPGTCVFENVEFRNEYHVNRLGNRDDEAALEAPRIVAVGDSYTMGWGVEQEESFASLIEAGLGVAVLNTGMSSYGTARELGMLARVDHSRLETVILQYCGNDAEENHGYLSSNRLGPKTRAEFEAVISYSRGAGRFHPLRRIYGVYQSILAPPAMDALAQLGWSRWAARRSRGSAAVAAAVSDFLAVLENAPAELSRARLIVTEIGSNFRQGSRFLPELQAAVARLPSEDWRHRIETVDVLAELDAEDYYALDPHLNARGHRRVADMLLARLRGD